MNDNEIQHIPLIGEMLPTMQVQTTHGPKTIPGDYTGKWLVFLATQLTSLQSVLPNSFPSRRIMINSAR